jgi:hypothetical protein
MLLNLVLFAVFLACVAMHVREGLWSNAISFFNVMTAALIASNYFEPLADWLTNRWPSYTYVFDYLALWLIFSVVMILLRTATDYASRVKVRFKMPVDWAGGVFFACWIGWIMVCFTTFSLHTAPLARNFMSGAFQPEPDDSMFLGLAPDRQWLALMHTLSLDGSGPDGLQGSLSRTRAENEPPENNVFDPRGEFILKYGASREKFENEIDIRTRGTR